jgi:sigma-B regulation protein RsbU (phosphoserine phosphatase)
VPGLHLSILRDVTDRRADGGQNEEAQALRDQFVAAITHDLRSPLAIIRLNADLLTNTPGLPKSVLDFGQRIARQVAWAERMITDVLDVSRICAGRPLLVQRRHMDLEPVLLAWVEGLEPLYRNPLRCHTAGGTPGEWDPAALRRVFENLVANAAKYGAPNGPIDVTLGRRDGEVVLSVHNEGNPLRTEEMQGIFHPFSRVDEGAARQG